MKNEATVTVKFLVSPSRGWCFPGFSGRSDIAIFSLNRADMLAWRLAEDGFAGQDKARTRLSVAKWIHGESEY
jgi:hypothetical protein